MILQRIKIFFLLIMLSSLVQAQEQPLLFLSSNEYKKQLNDLENLIIADSTNPDLYIERANFNIRLNNYELALNDVYKIKSLNGNELYINLLRGELAIVSKNYGIAERFIEKAEKEASTDKEFYQVNMVKSDLMNQQGIFEEAANYANEAISIDSTINAIYLNANAQKTVMDFNKSDFYYRILLEKVDDRPDLFLEYADMFMRQEDYENAQIQALKALDLDSNNVKAHNYLGTIYYHLNNYPLSLNHVNMALKLDPKNFNIFKERAFIYLKLNEVNNACDDMFRSLQNGYMESNVTMDLLSLYLKVCEI